MFQWYELVFFSFGQKMEQKKKEIIGEIEPFYSKS